MLPGEGAVRLPVGCGAAGAVRASALGTRQRYKVASGRVLSIGELSWDPAPGAFRAPWLQPGAEVQPAARASLELGAQHPPGSHCDGPGGSVAALGEGLCAHSWVLLQPHAALPLRPSHGIPGELLQSHFATPATSHWAGQGGKWQGRARGAAKPGQSNMSLPCMGIAASPAHTTVGHPTSLRPGPLGPHSLATGQPAHLEQGCRVQG